jgi:hypothetical protein
MACFDLIPRIKQVISLISKGPYLTVGYLKSYFRETTLPPVLCSLLLFPPTLQLHDAAPQEFALQFWDNQKQSNAVLVVGIMGMLVGSKGSGVSDRNILASLELTRTLGSRSFCIYEVSRGDGTSL